MLFLLHYGQHLIGTLYVNLRTTQHVWEYIFVTYKALLSSNLEKPRPTRGFSQLVPNRAYFTAHTRAHSYAVKAECSAVFHIFRASCECDFKRYLSRLGAFGCFPCGARSGPSVSNSVQNHICIRFEACRNIGYHPIFTPQECVRMCSKIAPTRDVRKELERVRMRQIAFKS